MKKTPEKPVHDWTHFDAMSDDTRHAAALADPDAAARAYLVVIGRKPDAVLDALGVTR